MTEEEKELDKDQLRLFDTQEEKAEDINSMLFESFKKWLKHEEDIIINTPINELIGRAYYAGFWKGKKF